MTINLGSAGWAPDSCTLPTAEQPVRIAEFDAFFAASVRAIARPDRTRLDLVLVGGAEPEGRDLTARESGCCSFFTFTFDGDENRPVLHVEVPATHVDVLDAFERRGLAQSSR
ncbi:hypothetical protein IU450_34480 [Nocardia abscessus]|uniref:hypothetical protein n=1 Tax=Nocardia abscessus TaxID=120957 RepID=UPI001895EE4A|nr:hypothetical protein [Nocardia abscessus]MBF6340961.1 hypothetical protein [Nocardia abscessus]